MKALEYSEQSKNQIRGAIQKFVKDVSEIMNIIEADDGHFNITIKPNDNVSSQCIWTFTRKEVSQERVELSKSLVIGE